ncbi:hypothetical protein F4809DRAFT_180879 [Biscogniauxia mediterranea]|nr:hypothetical protein F4809DRAFT_180879 [Biscogniauxia mediterranea]
MYLKSIRRCACIMQHTARLGIGKETTHHTMHVSIILTPYSTRPLGVAMPMAVTVVRMYALVKGIPRFVGSLGWRARVREGSTSVTLLDRESVPEDLVFFFFFFFFPFLHVFFKYRPGSR